MSYNEPLWSVFIFWLFAVSAMGGLFLKGRTPQYAVSHSKNRKYSSMIAT